jgi:hypothetical protein
MTTKPPARKISFADIFTFDFWRYLVKAIWLFFPPIFFLILGYFAFWSLSQGKDIMLITLEQGKEFVFLYCILAVFFWTYVTWYSSRLVGKAKGFQQPDENHIWIRLRLQLPRLLAFSCLSVVILAFLQLPGYRIRISSCWSLILLFLGIPYYFLIYVLWEKFLKKDYAKERHLKFLRSVRNIAIYIMLAATITVSLLQSYLGIILLFLGMQIGLTLLLIIRRTITELLKKSMFQQDEKELEKRRKANIMKRSWSLLSDDEDRVFSRAFLIISVIPVLCYLSTIISVNFSIELGSFPFVVLAFSILLILGNTTALLSVLARFNLHMIFWAVAFIAGWFSDPHKVRLIEKKDATIRFENRQKLKEYFTDWVKQRYPNPDSIQKKQPVYFVLADGGASRSGYWVASVLSRFEDSTGGKFSQNLFCLSGASGGSVGNATFYNILRNKKYLAALRSEKISDTSCLYASRSYLQTDFLTYTVARLLGPDVFRYVLPFLMPVKDRALALTKAMEEAPDAHDTSRIINSKIIQMNVGMSEIMTQMGKPASLPILCINTTRMQDGQPGVISTININEDSIMNIKERFFNGRIDVLSLVDEKKDLKLSSSVVLGASFPYLSPAGRIDKKIKIKKDNVIKEVCESEYFVDGGYFDNSGAGVTNEMIIGMMQLMIADTAFLSGYKDKLDFFILHITNNPTGGEKSVLTKVNPLINDLASPIKTIAGSYGTQTSVNDSRLKNYMINNFGSHHYTMINLYKEDDQMSFPMNWVISKRVLDTMDVRLEKSQVVKDMVDSIKARVAVRE